MAHIMTSISTIYINFDIEASNTKPNHFNKVFSDKKTFNVVFLTISESFS